MKANTLISSAAVTSILAAALVTIPTVASAGEGKKKERCGDVIKGGKNTCAVKSLGISCQGNATKDNMKGAWVKVPAGTCANIVAICLGAVEAPEGAFKSDKKREKVCSKIATQTDASIVGGRLVDKNGESI